VRRESMMAVFLAAPSFAESSKGRPWRHDGGSGKEIGRWATPYPMAGSNGTGRA